MVNSYTEIMPTPDRTSLDAIVSAARDLLEQEGLGGLTMQAVATRVGSPALRADGLLSGVGAAQAAVTLLGTLAVRWFGWTWMDAAAAIAVGTVAVVVAIRTAPEAPDELVGPEGIEPSA